MQSGGEADFPLAEPMTYTVRPVTCAIMTVVFATFWSASLLFSFNLHNFYNVEHLLQLAQR